MVAAITAAAVVLEAHPQFPHPTTGIGSGGEGRREWGCIMEINIPFVRLSKGDNTNSDHMQLGKGKKDPTASGGRVGLESKNRGGALEIITSVLYDLAGVKVQK